MKRISKFLAFLLVFAIILPGMAQAAPATGAVKVERISGLNRSMTSIAASKKAYKTADSVVLVGFKGSPDALSATAFASTKNAPMLITAGGKSLSKEIKAEITRLKAKEVIIVGGSTVVPAAMENELKAMKVKVSRMQGKDRYQTAAKMAQYSSNKSKVFLTIGRNVLSTGAEDSLADALAIGPVSAMKQMPILLAQTNEIPRATMAALNSLGVKEVTIIGGELAISPKVADQLKSMNITVTRDAGKNRYETAVIVADKYFKDSKNVIVAEGRRDADALVGGYLGAKWNAPILLTAYNKLAPETQMYLQNNRPNTYVMGGEAVVNKSVVEEIKTALSLEVQESKEFFEKEIAKVTEITSGTEKVADIDYDPATGQATVELLDENYLEQSGTGVFKELENLGLKSVTFDGGKTWTAVTPENVEQLISQADIVEGKDSFTVSFQAKVQPQGKSAFYQTFQVEFKVK